MRRLVSWSFIAIAAVVVLTIAAIVALPRIVDTPRVQSLIAASASQALARPVKFQSLSASVLPYPTVHLGKLEVGEDATFGGGAFLRLDDADLRLKLWPLLRGRVEFATLVLKRPTIALVQGGDGRWNFASLGTARETTGAPRTPRAGGVAMPPAPLVSRIVVDDGRVTYERRGPGPAASGQRLEKVDMVLVPRPGALSFSGSARAMPGEVAVTITEGTLGLAGARTLADASVRARIAVDGKDVGPLVAAALGPEPAVAGALSGRLSVSGTVGRPRATGDVEVQSPEVARTSAECPEPKRRRLALSSVKASLTWDDGRLVVQPLATGLGHGSITSKLAAVPARVTQVELSDLVLREIPLERVLVDFLCQPYAVTGPVDLIGAVTLSSTDLLGTLSGSGQVRIGPGKVVGVGARDVLTGIVRVGSAVSTALILDAPRAMLSSPLEFDSITATYQIRNGVVTTQDLFYTSRAMKIRVTGDYAVPSGQVDLDVVLDHGRGRLQAKVTGPAGAPTIRVAPSAIARQVDSDKVERRLKDLLKKFR